MLQYNRTSYSEKQGSDFLNVELAFLLNPATNLKIFGSYTTRRRLDFTEYGDHVSSDIIYFGIKTDLRNLYYDF